MDEFWKAIPGYGGHYEASNFGNIRVKPRTIVKPHSKTGLLKEYSYAGRELAIFKDTSGYLCVTIGVDGKTIKRSVHTLIATAFHGERIGNLVVCHGNGIKTDNRPENLRWDSQFENNQDRKRHGTYQKGEKHPMAKLTQANINEIRSRKLNASDVMASYGIHVLKRVAFCQGKHGFNTPQRLARSARDLAGEEDGRG